MLPRYDGIVDTPHDSQSCRGTIEVFAGAAGWLHPRPPGGPRRGGSSGLRTHMRPQAGGATPRGGGPETAAYGGTPDAAASLFSTRAVAGGDPRLLRCDVI